MATLIINGDLTVLPPKIVRALKARHMSVWEIANCCGTTEGSVRATLSDLKMSNMVDHDGKSPRTWRLVEAVSFLRVPQRTVPPNAKKRPFTLEEDGVIVQLRSEGMSVAEIGRQTNRRPDVIKNRLVVLRSKSREIHA